MFWIIIGLCFISIGFWGPSVGYKYGLFIPQIEYWDIAALGLTFTYNIYFYITETDDNSWQISCTQKWRRCVKALFVLSMLSIGLSISCLIYLKDHFASVVFVLCFAIFTFFIDLIVKRQANKSLKNDNNNPLHHIHYRSFGNSIKYIDIPSIIAFSLVVFYVIFKQSYASLPIQNANIMGLLSGAVAFQMIAFNIIFAHICHERRGETL